MEKFLKKEVDKSEYRYYLMGFGFEPYRVAKIQFDDRSNNIFVDLELKE